MRNPIAVCLYTLGILIILGAFIAGIIAANENYYGFEMSIALTWWASGIISGIFFIGIGEIINLLQKLLDHKNPSAHSRSSALSFFNDNEALSTHDHSAVFTDDNLDIKIKDLTIVMNNERFKGQFLITPEELKILKKSFFQNDSEAELIATINRDNIAPAYEKNKEYIIFSYFDRNVPFQISFKTVNIYDYQKVIDHLQLQLKMD